MKKFLLFIAVCACALTASAQKTTEYHSAQARVLDVNTNAFVMPKVVELEMIKAPNSNADCRIQDSVFYTSDDIQAMIGQNKSQDVEANIRANASFRLCRKYGADVIVGALYEIQTQRAGFIVRVIGYPARFAKWRNIQEGDYKWIGLKSGTTDAEKTKAIVK